MTQSILLYSCVLWMTFTLYGCEETTTPIAASDNGSQTNGGQANTSTRPMCQEMNDHAGAIAACTSSGTLCTSKSDIYEVRNCLIDEVETLATVSVACDSIDDCGILSYGSCGSVIAIAADQVDIASELSCRLSSCATSLDYSINCETPPSMTQYNQPTAACVNNICVVQEAQE